MEGVEETQEKKGVCGNIGVEGGNEGDGCGKGEEPSNQFREEDVETWARGEK